jgi:hypothetical protein
MEIPVVHVEVVAAGESFEISRVGLYPAPNIAEWKSLMAKATTQLGGVSLGLGFLGSPGWVITGALAMGYIEGALSNASQVEGVKTLQKAAAVLARIHRSRQLVPISEISGVEFADPGSWSAEAETERTFDVRQLRGSDLKRYLEKIGGSEANILDGIASVSGCVRHVSLGEDFVPLECRVRGFMQLRWSSIASYRLVS